MTEKKHLYIKLTQYQHKQSVLAIEEIILGTNDDETFIRIYWLLGTHQNQNCPYQRTLFLYTAVQLIITQ